ncbi:MAG: N-acetyl-gamma-glutamyl-phosphate reductase [Bacteroidota bacterium]
MIRIGIIGGAGYTAGELLRLLLNHPQAEIRFVHSQSQTGKAVYEIHHDLLGDTELVFTNQVETEVDVLFFCSGHGKTLPFLAAHDIPESVAIIDLSRDFRLEAPEHDFVYGLPELNREKIRETSRLANPGCFATCIQLGLLPLAAAGQLTEEVHIHAITGSTGAGQQPRSTTHFSWRNNNLSIYKAFSHQHLGEIRQSLTQAQGGTIPALNFLPMRGDFPRGIYCSAYLNTELSEIEAQDIYQHFYQDHPFTHVATANPHLKQVVNTNKAVVFVEKHEGKLLIISMIDNLLKGASGQAVQNMNLMFGLPETQGLQLKALAF